MLTADTLGSRSQTQTPLRGRLACVALAAGFLIVLLGAQPARGQPVVSVYGGAAATAKTAVTLSQPVATELTYRQVRWAGRSFETPPYYGLRFAYWFRRSPGWGLVVDYSHPKMIAVRNGSVEVRGRRNGVPLDSAETLSETFDQLEFSHGHNLLTLGAQYRWFSGDQNGRPARRARPYAGVGLGVAVPHVVVRTTGSQTSEYQVAGPAVQAQAGVDVQLTARLSLLLEGKLAFADIDADLAGGGRVEVAPWTGQLALGLSFSLWPRNSRSATNLLQKSVPELHRCGGAGESAFGCFTTKPETRTMRSAVDQ